MEICVLSVFVILFCAIYMVKCKHFLWPGVLCAIAVLLICVQLINVVSAKREFVLEEKTLRIISEIDWSADSCAAFGFELTEYGYYTADYAGPDFLCSITVGCETDDDLFSNKKEFYNISYEAWETGPGILETKRLFDDNIPVVRHYIFLVDGVQICVTEDNIEDNDSAFGEYLLKLVKQSQNIHVE